MRVVWDDPTDPQPEPPYYALRTLPGMDGVATPTQGLLWASTSWTETGNRLRARALPTEMDTPLFEDQA